MLPKFSEIKFKSSRIFILKLITLSIILSTIYTYYYTVNKYSVNFPLNDDYDAILSFINNWIDKDSEFSLLFSQHNEHRVVFLRITSLLYYKIFSSINFIHLTVLGNCFVLLLLAALYNSVNDKRKFILFSPVFFFILNYSHWEIQTWTMAALSVYPMIASAFFSLYLINKTENAYFFLGLVFAIISSFSQGNGIFVFVAGILILFKNKPRLILWISTGLLTIYIYFILFPYHRPSHHPSIELFKLDKIFLVNRIFYGLTLLSSVFHSKIILVLGVIPLLFIFYIFKNYNKFSKLHIAMILFLLISSVSITISRDGFGYEQAFASRYQLTTILLYAVIYICFLPYIKIKKHLFLVILLTGLFYFNSNIYNVNNFFSRKTEILADKICKETCNHYNTYPNDGHAANILITSEKKGTFYIINK